MNEAEYKEFSGAMIEAVQEVVRERSGGDCDMVLVVAVHELEEILFAVRTPGPEMALHLTRVANATLDMMASKRRRRRPGPRFMFGFSVINAIFCSVMFAFDTTLDSSVAVVAGGVCFVAGVVQVHQARWWWRRWHRTAA